jgi:hypothetical protein
MGGSMVTPKATGCGCGGGDEKLQEGGQVERRRGVSDAAPMVGPSKSAASIIYKAHLNNKKVEKAPSKFTNGKKKPQNEPEEEDEKPKQSFKPSPTVKPKQADKQSGRRRVMYADGGAMPQIDEESPIRHRS